MIARRSLPLWTLAAAALLASAHPQAAAARRGHRRSPRVEIAGVARVETVPRRRVHGNGREFEELDVTLLSAAPAAEQFRGADVRLPIDTARRIHLVHDLSCGGAWVDLSPGDRVDVQGEYVQVTGGAKNVLHFTHSTGGACGTASGHPGGYLRRR